MAGASSAIPGDALCYGVASDHDPHMERISLARTQLLPLARGLQALRLMPDGAAQTLDSLSSSALTPKASMLRLLRKAPSARRGWSSRIPPAGAGPPWARIVPIADQAAQMRARHAHVLDRLVRNAGQVVELYVREGDCMRMIDRREPEQAAVSLRAQIGFRREAEEIEAVAQLLIAFAQIEARAGHYHCRGEERVRMSRQRVRSVAQGVRSAGWSADLGQNLNGVRRVAVPIMSPDGDLIGALAIAALGPAAEEAAVPRLRGLLLASAATTSATPTEPLE